MTGFALIRSCGIAVTISWYTDIFSLIARSMRTRPMRNWFSSSSPTARTRRLPGTQVAIDLDQRFLRCFDGVFAKRQAEHDADIVALRKENRQFRHARVDDGTDDVLSQLVVGFDDDFAGICIHDVADGK